MKIAQVAPLIESVPPKWYGGSERVVSYLTEELVQQGHDVTLYASGDSVTRARLRPPVAHALRLNPQRGDPLIHHFIMLEEVFKDAAAYDIIHFHVDFLHFPLSRRHAFPTLTTLHGRLDIPDLELIHRTYREMPLVSISDAQRRPLTWANWKATVHHGLPSTLYSFHPDPGGYLAFLGRISPEKRVDRAIDIACRSGMPIKIAAKVDPVDADYFEARIRPLLARHDVEYIGEIGEHEKNAFLGEAYALLFPIDWPEPFGLVMIEAMACGTPVIAYDHGAVSEVMEDGITGYVVDDLDTAVSAVERVAGLDRQACRDCFERRFSVSRMANDYMDVYRRMLSVRSVDMAVPQLAG
ncbi:MAG TPA: glycosyltransferase family 4 protein [Gammaproteobacteria bacterium]